MSLDRSLEMSAMIPAQDLPGILSAVARGQTHATDLSREAAHALFAEWLSGHLSALAQGALWTAFRFKGESTDELLGFVAATEDSLTPLAPPSALRPVVFPSYNGARRHANLLPLLALLLARQGVPVLIHGTYGGIAADADLRLLDHDPSDRTTSGEILADLGFAPAASRHAVHDQLARHHLAYVPLDVLHPRLAAILALRRQLGVRSSVHTVIKLFNPFAGPAVRCAAVTHPPYLARMRAFFVAAGATALVLRGTEGEPVTHPRRRPALIGIEAGCEREWFPEDRTPLAKSPDLPADRGAPKTCQFIEEVLAGQRPLPSTLRDQAACLLVMSGAAPDLATACARIDHAQHPIRRRSR
ncbi:DNA-binding protein YbiB [Acidiferrobacter thiooxydans]|jgi:anthranilate phosphoribosyltransferase|uniref:DNA-binding protein YbiB n=1 Tax=Acidiferrobacter thiooxydans TaxID=163359 RepID=A0A368HFA7_9GAMM|nr:DNA-binding protein YbiB [Acidiferrobacter thiooxydans]MDA8191822.1 DNA-binding protein YbiB [Gammaproteobacteria bacterium]RCN55869.1 DNA-binding protein YbiB [Acidiferrobacter thiooxydans]UEN98880.1 DNA-binding protein YbiB [Acidiferrobacter thiooxydans]